MPWAMPVRSFPAMASRPLLLYVAAVHAAQVFGNRVRFSRLGLTWGNGGWPEGCPQVKRAQPTFCGGGSSGSAGSWHLRAVVCLDDLEGELLELGEQGAEPFRIVEQRLVFGELAGG